jgi:hypothetical protein
MISQEPMLNSQVSYRLMPVISRAWRVLDKPTEIAKPAMMSATTKSGPRDCVPKTPIKGGNRKSGKQRKSGQINRV